MKILITGGATGIGFETALYLCRLGHDVIIGAKDNLQIENAKSKIQDTDNIEFIKLDVLNEQDRKAIKNKRIDVLINNAGIGAGGSIAEIDMKKVRETFEVNVFCQFELMQDILLGMVERGKGRIVIISSLLGEMPMKFFGVYAASKSALVTFATALNRELKMLKKNVSVCLIEPGMYHTGFNQKMINKKFLWMEEDSYFNKDIEKLKKNENRLFRMFEKTDLLPLAKVIGRAATVPNPRFKYRRPVFQSLGVKLYNIFIK